MTRKHADRAAASSSSSSAAATPVATASSATTMIAGIVVMAALVFAGTLALLGMAQPHRRQLRHHPQIRGSISGLRFATASSARFPSQAARAGLLAAVNAARRRMRDVNTRLAESGATRVQNDLFLIDEGAKLEAEAEQFMSLYALAGAPVNTQGPASLQAIQGLLLADKTTVTAPEEQLAVAAPSATAAAASGNASPPPISSTIKASLLHLMQLQADLEVLRGGLSDDAVLRQASVAMAAVSAQIKTAVTAVEEQTGRAAAAVVSKLQLGPHGSTKLQLGAAGDSSEVGWVNVDLLGGAALSSSKARQELALNIATQPLPLKDESCAFVYAAHVLEHLEFPEGVFFVLHEAWRVLKPGGTFRLAVPDAKKWIDAYAKDSSGLSGFWKGARQQWPDFSWGEEPTLSIMLQYLGAIGAMDNPHRAAYDVDSLQSVLRDAGFVDVKPSTFQGSDHLELRVDDTSAAARATYGEDEHYSLFMEATKEGPQPQGVHLEHQKNLRKRNREGVLL